MALDSLLLFLFTLAALCLLASWYLRLRSGLPSGQIIYEDSSGKNSRVLVSQRYGLRGKPDYLLEDAVGVIPVEVKSGLMPPGGRPHRSHLLQLAVYFLLVEEDLQQTVLYGLIRYQNGAVRVENTDELREDLLSVVAQMRRALASDDARRSHRQARRCAACSMAHACDERLA